MLLTSAAMLNIAAARCCTDPVPEEPKLIFPGLFLHCSTTSLTEPVEFFARVTRMCGVAPTMAMGAKSFSGS